MSAYSNEITLGYIQEDSNLHLNLLCSKWWNNWEKGAMVKNGFVSSLCSILEYLVVSRNVEIKWVRLLENDITSLPLFALIPVGRAYVWVKYCGLVDKFP
jgi:hypothetical protein